MQRRRTVNTYATSVYANIFALFRANINLYAIFPAGCVRRDRRLALIRISMPELNNRRLR